MDNTTFKKKNNEKNINKIDNITRKNAGKTYGKEVDELKSVLIYMTESQHKFLTKTVFFNKDEDEKFKNVSQLIRYLIDEFEEKGSYLKG